MKNLEFISKKKMILSFMLFALAILIPLFSSYRVNNFWNSLLEIITNGWYSLMIFLAICIYISDFLIRSKNENFILRSHSYLQYVKNSFKVIVKVVLIYLLVSILMATLGASILTNFSYTIIDYNFYSIPIYMYVIFFIIRTYIIFSILAIILYMLSWHFSYYYTSIYYFIILIPLIFNLGVTDKEINEFIDIPLFATSYLGIIHFSNFLLEFSASLFIVSLLLCVVLLLYHYCFSNLQKDKLK